MQDPKPTSFQAIIDLWPSMRAFGGEVLGDPEQGRVKHRRNRVPRKFWPQLTAALEARGLVVDTVYLEQLWTAGQGQGR